MPRPDAWTRDMSAADARAGNRHRFAHGSVRASFRRATTATVWATDREHTLVAAVNEATGEVKYFLTSAATAPLTRVLAVAFRRWTVEDATRGIKYQFQAEQFWCAPGAHIVGCCG